MSELDLVWHEPQTPAEIMDDLIYNYNKDKFYVLFSGGKDSVCVADYVSRNYPEQFGGVVFTNTGIGTQLTRQFVIEYTTKRKWPLLMTWAHRSYYDFVMKFGFPDPRIHRIVMGFLKYQTWYYFMKWRLSLDEKACFISGVRKKESWIRNKYRFYTKTPIDKDAHLVFAKPFLYKNGSQLMRYFFENDLKKSKAYEFFQKSGECWCGAYSHNWELKMLQVHDPLTFETIKWLEKEIQIHGTPHAKKYAKWGNATGTDNAELQSTLEVFMERESKELGIKINDDYCGESCE